MKKKVLVIFSIFLIFTIGAMNFSANARIQSPVTLGDTNTLIQIARPTPLVSAIGAGSGGAAAAAAAAGAGSGGAQMTPVFPTQVTVNDQEYNKEDYDVNTWIRILKASQQATPVVTPVISVAPTNLPPAITANPSTPPITPTGPRVIPAFTRTPTVTPVITPSWYPTPVVTPSWYPTVTPTRTPTPIPTCAHSGGTATCKALAICTKCGKTYGSLANHKYTDTCSKVHCKRPICCWCGVHQTSCGGDHIIASTWSSDGTYHWKGCTVSGCTLQNSKAAHSGGTATCTKGKVCTTCQREYTSALGHTGGSATCKAKAVCTRCNKSYGSLAAHSYTSTCSKVHCKEPICCWCGLHKDGTCGGGHNTSGYCNHCSTTYCTLCMSTHNCTHNSSGKCTTDVHCAGVTWCTNCERIGTFTHVHKTCSNFSSSFTTCSKAHCTAKICPKCNKHQTTCGGDHVCTWQGAKAKTSATEKHEKKCTVSGCNYVETSHNPNWGMANTSHTATCTTCNYYTYTHTPSWQKVNATSHKCVGNDNKCTATHTPTWGEYYKISEQEHTRKCTFGNCQVVDESHEFEGGTWTWNDANTHIKTCQHTGCGLTTTQSHSFKTGNAGYDKKTPDATNYTELYKHWLVCKTCDTTVPAALKPHGNVDEAHTDDGTGKCSKCGQRLWKMVTDSGVDITDYVLGINTGKLPSKNKEKIKIIEVKTGTVQYVQNILDENSNRISAVSNEFTLTKNGTYKFTTCRGGLATFSINHISNGVVIERLINPVTSTDETVTITLRSAESEKDFDKKIYILEGSTMSDSALQANGTNPAIFSKVISENGTYTFIARDTAGNTEIIKIVIDNIIKGRATVAISNDVFINGYAFAEILINPNESWTINKNNITSIINARVYKTGSLTPKTLNSSNIRLVKVMDMQRRDITSSGPTYAAGEYYLQIAIGGNVFSEKATYIIDLENIKFGGKTLNGQNRVIVEVQDLKDLT